MNLRSGNKKKALRERGGVMGIGVTAPFSPPPHPSESVIHSLRCKSPGALTLAVKDGKKHMCVCVCVY